MGRVFGTFLLLASLSMVLLAQEEPKVELKKKPRPAEKTEVKAEDPKADDKKAPEKKEELKKIDFEEKEPAKDGVSPQKIQEIINRLHKNMDKAEDHLEKKDPGKDTTRTQEDIVRDLDELLKQSQQNGGGAACQQCMQGGGGGGGASGKASARASRSTGSSGKKSSAGSQAKSEPKGGMQDKKDGKAGGQEDGKDKKGGKDDLAKKGGEKEDGKDGKGGNGLGGKGQDGKQANRNFVPGDWGHLPANKRQEMEAYGKEKFLSKYEELLKQYYRTISEQGRTKPGE